MLNKKKFKFSKKIKKAKKSKNISWAGRIALMLSIIALSLELTKFYLKNKEIISISNSVKFGILKIEKESSDLNNHIDFLKDDPYENLRDKERISSVKMNFSVTNESPEEIYIRKISVQQFHPSDFGVSGQNLIPEEHAFIRLGPRQPLLVDFEEINMLEGNLKNAISTSYEEAERRFFGSSSGTHDEI